MIAKFFNPLAHPEPDINKPVRRGISEAWEAYRA